MITWIKGTGLPTIRAKPAIMFAGTTPTGRVDAKGKPVTIHSQTGARKLAIKFGGITFGDLTRIAKIPYTGMSKEDIAEVCEVWSENAKGTVHAAIGENVPAESTYVHKEKPAVMKNEEVEELLEYAVDKEGNLGKPVEAKKKK